MPGQSAHVKAHKQQQPASSCPLSGRKESFERFVGGIRSTRRGTGHLGGSCREEEYSEESIWTRAKRKTVWWAGHKPIGRQIPLVVLLIFALFSFFDSLITV